MGFDTNDDGSVLRIFGVHTDIGYLKAEKPLLIKGALSNREQEILVMIMDGMLNKEIAVRLNISKATVDRHRKNMLGKTGCKNSGALIARAIKDGWV
jgi:DNA-binding NarL/FixJ family response regulator